MWIFPYIECLIIVHQLHRPKWTTTNLYHSTKIKQLKQEIGEEWIYNNKHQLFQTNDMYLSKNLHLRNFLLVFLWVFETHIFINRLQHLCISLSIGFSIEEFRLPTFQTLISNENDLEKRMMKTTCSDLWRKQLAVAYEKDDL